MAARLPRMCGHRLQTATPRRRGAARWSRTPRSGRRDRFDSRLQLLEEPQARLGGRIIRRRQLHPHSRQSVDCESRIGGVEGDEAAQHQARAAEQDHGQRQFADDQRVAQAGSPGVCRNCRARLPSGFRADWRSTGAMPARARTGCRSRCRRRPRIAAPCSPW